MNLVLRQGALKDGEGYTFTLHITDLTTGEEGFASIDLLPNQPPVGGSCRLSPKGPLRALMAKVHFECAGESVRAAGLGIRSPLCSSGAKVPQDQCVGSCPSSCGSVLSPEPLPQDTVGQG